MTATAQPAAAPAAPSVNALALLFGALAARHLAHDESTKLERARAAGEPNL